ncbi:MAG: phospho-N-acetylmuramoyl-pentapeptide-transferase [Bacteroidota bacterium]
MLYYLSEWLNQHYDLPGFGVFRYFSFRAILSIVFSLIISLLIGKKIIQILRSKLAGEVIRKEGPESHQAKAGTPTMGGIIIISAVVIPTLLWADIKNGYVWLLLISTLWMGIIGFVDDYIKVFKRDKRGLKGRFKVIGQIGLGLIVGLTMLNHPDFMGSRSHISQLGIVSTNELLSIHGFLPNDQLVQVNGKAFQYPDTGEPYENISSYLVKREGKAEPVFLPIEESARKQVGKELFGPREKSFIYTTDFPFFKKYVFDYSRFLYLDRFINSEMLGRIVYLLVVILIITSVSNAVNITDGIDGLAAGTSAIVAAGLGIFAYISGNSIFANYLNITYIPLSAEITVYASALVGGCLGFLWYNSFKAEVFMGDTGSLALGSAIGVIALMVKKELLLPIFCGIFFAEALSVILQVSYFKYTKKKYGEGKRIFKMSPLHHHYELKGLHEAKIVIRFFIVQIILVLLAFATLKLR